MVDITATQARNNIGKLWTMARSEPVTIESAGKPIAVVIGPEEYAKMNSRPRKERQLGTMKDKFEGVDIDARLDISVDEQFADYV